MLTGEVAEDQWNEDVTPSVESLHVQSTLLMTCCTQYISFINHVTFFTQLTDCAANSDKGKCRII